MKAGKVFSVILLIVILIGLFASLFVLDETQQAIITQFGKPVGQPITTAGIHFKMPLIQKVLVFDKRLLEWDGNPQEIPTKDNKFIYIDTFARWRITDALTFYKSNRSEMVGYSRLDDLLDGAVRDEIANHSLPEIIRSSEREMNIAIVESDGAVTDIDSSRMEDLNIAGARKDIMETIVVNVRSRLADLQLGIEVLDLQIKRIDYNPEVQRKVFDRMISEQKQIAEKYRAIGQGEKERILGKLAQRKKKILSGAYLQAQTIRGEADAEAVSIYAAAYNRNSDARKFYGFMRSLEAYRSSIDSTTMLILTTDNEFLEFLESSE